MKHLKLFESFIGNIHSICEIYGIKNYTINEDRSIDANGTVYLDSRNFKELPLKFRKVTGSFYCHHNQLTSLEGCPISVDDSFYCYNNELTSLEGGPESIGGDFDCSYNKFICSQTSVVTSLEGCPKSIGGDFDCSHNKIVTFEHLPFSIGGRFNCIDNPLYEVWRLFEDYSKIELFNYYDIIQDDVVILDRLNIFLEEIGKRPVKRVKGYKCI